MTWEILAALITVVLALVTLGTVLGRLIRTLTKLDCAVESFGATISDMKAKSAKTHAVIFDKLEKHEEQISGHELRIHDIENKLS